MEPKPKMRAAIPVLPASDAAASLQWWVTRCGFTETFRDATPPAYVGIERDGTQLHLVGITEENLARTIGEQTMVRIRVDGIAHFYAEFKQRGGVVHPNGPLQTKPWGTTEFAAIDPNGVCITFQE
jgi:uncharacterized glyoxalase superfamily protein PhnB